MSYSLNELINKLDSIINFKAAQLEDLSSVNNVASDLKASYGNNALDYSEDLSLEAVKQSILYWHNIIISPNSYCPNYYYRKGDDGKLIHPLADDLKDMTVDNYNKIIERFPKFEGLEGYGQCLCNSDNGGFCICNSDTNPICSCNADDNFINAKKDEMTGGETVICPSDTTGFKHTAVIGTDNASPSGNLGYYLDYDRLVNYFNYNTCNTNHLNHVYVILK